MHQQNKSFTNWIKLEECCGGPLNYVDTTYRLLLELQLKHKLWLIL